MIDFEEKKIVYCNVPRTGSNVIRPAISETFKLVETPEFRCKFHGTKWYPKFDDYTIVLSIRHPYRRVLSLWAFFKTVIYEYYNPGSTDDPLIQKSASRRPWNKLAVFNQPTLEAFLNRPFAYDNLCADGSWAAECCYKRLPREPDYIVHTETMLEDLQKIPGVSVDSVPQWNKSFAATSWYRYLRPYEADMIKERLAFEFDKFGYTRDLEAVKRGEYFV